MSFKKRLVAGIAILFFVFLCCSLIASNVYAQKVIPFNFGFVSSPNMQGGVYGQLVEKYVNEYCEGKVKAKFFASGLLGTDPEMMDKTRLGLMQGMVAPLNVFGNAVPYVDVLMLPFVSNSWERVHKFVDSPVAVEFLAGVERYGYKGLGFTGYGLSGIESNTKASTLEELQRLKFRVPESPVLTKTFQALRITPMVIQFPDLYESLKQGVVDGCDLPADVAVFAKFVEVIKYFIKTNHNFGWYMFIVNKDWYDKLPSDVRGPFTEAIEHASKESRERSFNAEIAAIKLFGELGIEVIDIDPAELQKMIDLTQSVFDWRLSEYDEFSKQLAKKTLEAIGYEYDWSRIEKR
ncbi:MAG: TRAP transporter substrate-binding protein [Syntrophales bacterium]|jgi:TRAP-type C4-dicarboxylate transport system substrate-binding protein|nr:TRAP transporter substrate-binding protein [Syntrophales bacterium]MDX9922876.1 TRAP transporter substrate-binding protein [Syntrophales bacterium]